MKIKIILTAVMIFAGFFTQAQTENLALTFDNAQITNDGANDFYEADVFITRTSVSDFKLGDGQFYLDYNPLAFGNSIGDAEVDFVYTPGSVLSETNLFNVYGSPIINSNAATTVSLAWSQELSAGSMAANNVTDTPALLAHLKIQMSNTAEAPNICFNVVGNAFDDQFYTACGPFTGGAAFKDCSGVNAATQIIDYDGSDCSGSVIPVDVCTTSATWTTAMGWSPGAPDSSTEAIFEDSYDTTDGNITACRIVVQNGATLSIGALEFVIVETDITVDSGGAISVAHTGSIVQVDDDAAVTNNGTIEVFVDTPGLDGRDFIVLGSPMSMETRADVFIGALQVRNHLTENFTLNTDVGAGSPGAGNWVDEEGDDWPIYSGAINPGEGYLVMRDLIGPSAALNLNFNTGTLNNGVTTYTAGYNGSRNSSPNIIANPYASAISATDFINTNTGVVDAVYFWEHVTSPSAGIPGPYGLDYTMEDISIFNLTGGTAAAGSDASTTPNGIISTGQGFGVKVMSAGPATIPVIFNNAMRRTTGNTTLRNQDLDRVWLNVQSEGYELKSTALIGFLDEATDGIDLGYDAKRLATNVSLYSHLDDGSDVLGIQARGTFEENAKIPMGFATLVDEKLDYTISIKNIEGLNLGTATAYLIDTFENVITNLSESNYTFMSEKGIYDNRFILQFTPEGVLGTNDNLLETVSVYPNPTQNIVTIVSPQTIVTSAAVYDIRGRIVSEVNFSNQTNYQIDLSSMEAALYFIDIVTESGTVNKRVIKKD